MSRLADPVTTAANLLGDDTADDPATAVRDILAAAPPAPADTMKVGSLLDELRAAAPSSIAGVSA
jgi:hypothetical protein